MQCEDDDFLTSADMGEVIQQGTVPMMSCQLTPEQSTAICRQLQQVQDTLVIIMCLPFCILLAFPVALANVSPVSV